MQPENSTDAGLAPALLDQWEEDAADYGCIADCDRIVALIAEVRRLHRPSPWPDAPEGRRVMSEAIENPDEAVCIFCGKTGATCIVGSRDVPGVPAHLSCWLNREEDDDA